MRSTGRPVIFFDGICNLCNGVVQFIIRHDKKLLFLFAPLQSEAGKKAIAALPLPTSDSIILSMNGKYYTKSDAALRIAKELNGLWPVLYAFLVLPRIIRDGVYDIIARNRYRWFGKKNECMIPTPALKERFL